MQTRRQMMGGALALGASQLSGCVLVRPLTAFCPDDPRISNPKTPLTIDVHGHVFNGTDIQIERYISLVRARQTPALANLGTILQEVGWSVAPSGAQETAALREINQALSAGCGPGAFEAMHVAHRNDQYEKGVVELNSALDKVESLRRPGLRAMRGGNAVASAIRSLPKTYPAYRSQRLRATRKAAGGDQIEAAIAFVLRQFQYRYVNVFDFLSEYSSGSARKIDLVVCHFLDFDWPLAGGNATLTPIADQIDVMEQISILTDGRVHCCAPFDPMKQVAYDLGLTFESPLALVQKAILSQGFIGVKIYPPMGFAPIGNAAKSDSFWSRRKWLPDNLKSTNHVGARLDAALSALYVWCVRYDVPIMAHTSPSEGPADDFQALTAAKYWNNVPNGLRVNFGHFGNTEVTASDTARTLEYCNLMGGPGTHGANFYADAAYLSHALTDQRGLTNALQTLFRITAPKQSAALAQRLMYGSDWEMLVIEGSANTKYLSNFEQIFSQLDGNPSLGAQGKLSARFFGINAVNYLSLRPGSATRARLEAFYAARAIPTPQWMRKIPPLVA
jgi:amidohydrolase family protein